MPHEVDPRTRDRVGLLAKLLELRKGQVFCIPHCLGYKFKPLSHRIAFIFEIQSGVAVQPVSLNKLLNDEDTKIQLGKKSKLLHGLGMHSEASHGEMGKSYTMEIVLLFSNYALIPSHLRFTRVSVARKFFSFLKRT